MISKKDVLKRRCYYCDEESISSNHKCDPEKLKEKYEEKIKHLHESIKELNDFIGYLRESKENYKTDIEIFKNKIDNDNEKHKKEVDGLKEIIKNLKLKRMEMIEK